MMKIGIIIPSYRPDGFKLERAVKSIFQDKNALSSNVNVIVVDDCSGEGFQSIYDNLKSKFKDRVEVLYSARNSGPGSARNNGLCFADRNQFSVVGFLDADDEMEAGWLESVSDQLASDTIDLVTTGYKINGKPRGIDHDINIASWINGPFTRISSIFIKNKIFSEHGERFLPVYLGEDTEFIIRLCCRYRYVHVPVSTSCYRYDHKAHYIYPHPALSFFSSLDELSFEQKKLKEYMEKRNEFVGILLRKVKPDRNLKFHNIFHGLLIYMLGDYARSGWRILRTAIQR